MTEWVKNTGVMPVDGDVEIDLKFADGGILENDCADGWRWSLTGDSADIAEWKLAKSTPLKSTSVQLIGITGRAGSGKDTVADYLVENYGFTKISFAAILKNMLAVAGLPEPSNRDDKEKIIEGFDFSWRDAAQKLGTEWGRSLDSNIWVKLTMQSLKPGVKYVISDVRFDNEAAMVREKGILIHLSGRGVDLGELSGHASEAGVKGLFEDYYISNVSHKDYLFWSVDNILEDKEAEG